MANCFSTTDFGSLSSADRYFGFCEANLFSRSCISPRDISMTTTPSFGIPPGPSRRGVPAAARRSPGREGKPGASSPSGDQAPRSQGLSRRMASRRRGRRRSPTPIRWSRGSIGDQVERPPARSPLGPQIQPHPRYRSKLRRGPAATASKGKQPFGELLLQGAVEAHPAFLTDPDDASLLPPRGPDGGLRRRATVRAHSRARVVPISAPAAAS